METDKKLTPKFTWGQTVTFSKATPLHYRSKYDSGSVCAITVIENQAQSHHYGEEIETVIYLVEVEDGSTQHIPERFLMNFD